MVLPPYWCSNLVTLDPVENASFQSDRGSGRHRVLDAVASGAQTTAEIVTATGLHENTVRGHLGTLLADGRLARSRENPSGRGRPAWRWIAVGLSDPYVELSLALIDAMSPPDDDPVAAARAAGLRWGERLVADDENADAWEHVLTVMTTQGFAPEVVAHEPERTALLWRCPLLAAARGNESVVCTIHEGMVEGVAQQWEPGARAELEPFSQPHACTVRVRAVT
ncbi:Predicted transcriptional regulator, ArsR family [Ruaniaceae bacterium KH17]|nr:Predicted transcriptional regulator, ArsR family [Ruaniaceae bacterium KH17]